MRCSLSLLPASCLRRKKDITMFHSLSLFPASRGYQKGHCSQYSHKPLYCIKSVLEGWALSSWMQLPLDRMMGQNDSRELLIRSLKYHHLALSSTQQLGGAVRRIAE
eukprot:scaffold45077_cov26-Tisochrysis_lutea.AAC.1